MIGEIYWHPQTKQFFQVRGIHDDYLICGGMTDYHEDAFTDKQTQHLSQDFVDRCIHVTAIDKLAGVYHNGWGWTSTGKE